MDTINTNRQHKDRLFRFICNDKTNLLELYNAVNESQYTDEADLEINTLENVIYMKMKNDLSFVIDHSLNVYEHQSSFNPNMPIRGLFYLADLYRKMLDGKNLYGSKLVKMPVPRYLVFYNGTPGTSDREVLRLSDAFEKEDENACVEFKALMLNINYGHNRELMEKCSMLSGYAIFVHKVRTYAREMELGAAINRALDECIEEKNSLSDFFRKHRAEVFNLTLTEYDEAKVMGQFKEEYIQDGMEVCLMNLVLLNYKKGYPNENIAEYLDITEQEVEAMIKVIKQYPDATTEELVEHHRNGK